MDCTGLKLEIELARELLYVKEREYGSFQHPEVIRQSIVLDELMNKYYRATKKSPIHKPQT